MLGGSWMDLEAFVVQQKIGKGARVRLTQAEDHVIRQRGLMQSKHHIGNWLQKDH
jgi:hypothetical protein